MKNVENIFDGKKLIAVIYRKNIKVEGIKFLTVETNPFQVGIHNRKKGTSLPPHVHRIDKPITINSIQEILYVVNGKIKITLYGQKGNKLKSKTLLNGDSVLMISGGHSVKFIENSRIFEIKQGPYPGSEKAKTFL